MKKTAILLSLIALACIGLNAQMGTFTSDSELTVLNTIDWKSNSESVAEEEGVTVTLTANDNGALCVGGTNTFNMEICLCEGTNFEDSNIFVAINATVDLSDVSIISPTGLNFAIYNSGSEWTTLYLEEVDLVDGGCFNLEFQIEGVGVGFGESLQLIGIAVPPNTQYGFDDVTFTGACNCTCLEDVNNDGTINSADLGIVLANFGLTCEGSGCCDGDVNLDGVVNTADLTMVLGEFGLDCP